MNTGLQTTQTKDARRRAHRRAGALFAPGFTLLEILVVIAIFVLLAAVGWKGFQALVLNAERTLAENQLKAGLAAGRDAAIRSERGDGAAVFFYTPGGKITIVPCVSVGKFMDIGLDWAVTATDRTNPNYQFEREVFVPVAGLRPVELPRQWSVRGFVPPASVHSASVWTRRAPTPAILKNGWYPSLDAGVSGDPSQRRKLGNWVFPETGILLLRESDGSPITDPKLIDVQGAMRQTFMVRFKSRSGDLDLSNLTPVVVVDPIDSKEYRTARAGVFMGGSSSSQASQLIDPTASTDLAEWARRVMSISAQGLKDAGVGGGAPKVTADEFRQRLLGAESIDTVVAGPVSQLSLYNERHFIRALGRGNPKNKDIGDMIPAGLNSKGTIYQDPTNWDRTSVMTLKSYLKFPVVDPAVFPTASTDSVRQKLQKLFDLWVLGRLESRELTRDGTPQYEPVDAQIFVLQRSLGQVQEIKP